MKPHAYTQLLVHLVFAVKNRDTLLRKDFRKRVFEYIGGINTDLKHKSLLVNGMSDHVHILFGMNPNISVSDTVFHIKRGSSLFINNGGFIKDHFSWQEGYGAFSFCRRRLDHVYKYVLNQEQHHAEKTFRKEYVEYLKYHEIEYDDRYLFQFYDE
jgi:putative transposase